MNRMAAGLLLVALIGCGESKEVQANRQAITPLIHRNRALSEEFTGWQINNEFAETVSWQNTFDEYDKVIAAKESVLAEVRKIVPTKEYDCLIGLTGRSIQADIDLLHARKSYHQQKFKSSTALSSAEESLRNARASYYGADTYLRFAKNSLAEAKEADQQVENFKRSSNSNAVRAMKLGDSLLSAVLDAKILPSMTLPGYPVVTDSGPDSLFRASGKLAGPICR